MYIVYPYNEILPKKTAHDIYVVNNCLSLAKVGIDLDLVIGQGSLKKEALLKHYHAKDMHGMRVHSCPIIRNNNPIGLTWNRFFFFFSQIYLQKQKPDIVITSVIKQANFHFRRKLKHTYYVYEAHDLKWYPNIISDKKTLAFEKSVLEKADLITVTTKALKEILLSHPYSLKNRIEIISLGVHAMRLGKKQEKRKDLLTVMYVGQLYKSQGVSFLLKALKAASGIRLEIIGGKENEIERLKKEAENLNINDRVLFHGFYPPSQLKHLVKKADAFVTCFESVERMPYVAHTKLFEYFSWGRPIIAPDLEVVKEHLGPGKGALLFKPGSLNSLVDALHELKKTIVYDKLQAEINHLEDHFSWEERACAYKVILEDLIRQGKK